MGSEVSIVGDQAWSWLDDDPLEESAPINPNEVYGVILEIGTVAEQERCRIAIGNQLVHPLRLVHPDDLPDYAKWVWILPDTCEPTPNALQELLRAAGQNQAADIIACVSVQPKRRSAATAIENYGQTVSGFGRLRSLVDPGEFHQGQLSQVQVLGAPAAGMLVQADLWRYLNGFNYELPPQLWGVDLCWRANLCGAVVVVEPDAQVIDSLPDENSAVRAGTLALASAHALWQPIAYLKLTIFTALAALGFLLGKDIPRAAEEIAGLGKWLLGKKRRNSIRDSLERLKPTPEQLAATVALRPSRFSGIKHATGNVAGRIADWASTFAEQTESAGIDDMLGDDFDADEHRTFRIPVVLIGVVLAVICALIAGWQLLGRGALRALHTLPAAANASDMLTDYVRIIPGDANLSAPPWEALMGVFSLLTAGSPEILVSVVVLGIVPLAWICAFRLARQIMSGKLITALGAGAYSLAPILCGGLNNYGFGIAIWTLLLPVAGYSLWWWRREGRDRWRGAGALALWLLILTSLYPLTWLGALAMAAIIVFRNRTSIAIRQCLLVVAAPVLLLIGPWGGTLLAYPSRLLTGIEPSMADVTIMEWWRFPIAALDSSIPIWLSSCVMAALWLAAIWGALRRKLSLAILIVAAICALLAGTLHRLLLWVPPGEWARPTGLELEVVMVAALVLAAGIGLNGIGQQLRESTLGVRHFGVLTISISCVLAFGLAIGWWVFAGESGLSRTGVGKLPAFVLNDEESVIPGRTLAIKTKNGVTTWMLHESGYPRFGQVERGLVTNGNREAKLLARSVVGRLVAGSADDELIGDLVRLGVANIWLSGGDESIRMGISNTPGLQLGTGERRSMVWPVPGSGIAVVQSGAERVPAGNGQSFSVIPGENADPLLTLAQPSDSRWLASVDGVAVQPVSGGSFGQSFQLTKTSGVLSYKLDEGSNWWVWVQGIGFAGLLLLALPGLRVGGREAIPKGARRVAEVTL